MKKYFLSIMTIAYFGIKGQVIINPDNSEKNPKSYAGLEVRSNKKQGVQLPIVAITDISNNTHPINNPTDGLMVYNFNSTVPQGIFIWDAKQNNGRGMWKQMADTSNIITSMLMQNTTPYPLLENVPVGTFVSLLDTNFKIVANEIGATFSPTEGLTLPANSGYTISIALDIQTDLQAGKGMSNTDMYLHKYIIKLLDKDGNLYAIPSVVSDISIAGKNDNSHSVYASFTFPITLVPVTLFPHIAYENQTNGSNGGSYYLNQPTGNTGKIIIKSVNMHIEKGILAL